MNKKENFIRQFKWLRKRIAEIGKDNGEKWLKCISDGKRRFNGIRKKLKAKQGKWTRRERRLDALRTLLDTWLWSVLEDNGYHFSYELPSGLWLCGEAIDSDDHEFCIDDTKISCCVTEKTDALGYAYGKLCYDFGLAADNLDCEYIVDSVFRFDKKEGKKLKGQHD